MLLDSHALVWWLESDPRLSRSARGAIEDAENVIHVSAASAWEVAIKIGLKKLHVSRPLSELETALNRHRFVILPVTLAHGIRAGGLAAIHRDPFDRMLAAQAAEEELAIVSQDRIFDRYGIQRVW